MVFGEYQKTLRHIIGSEQFYRNTILVSLFGCFFVLSQLVIKINDPVKRKWGSTLLGILVVSCFCGPSGLHLFLMVLGNSLIFTYGYKRWCHMTSFIYSYIQLSTFFLMNYQRHHVVDREVAACALLMIMFLKMVHLAGEVQETFLSNGNKRNTRMEIYVHLRIGDVFHYSFCYVGLVTFFRYRTHYDWLQSPLHNYAERVRTTLLRTLDGGLLMICWLAIQLITPEEYILTDEFPENPFIYKMFYLTCCGVGNCCMLYLILVGNDIICMSSGMGVYPTSTKPRICAGPTEQFDLLHNIVSNPEEAKLQEYTFETVRSIDVFKSLFAPTLRDFWRNYNCCTHHFFAMNVYKKFPVKGLRLFATFLMSALWHGYYLGWYVGMLSSAIYIEAEDIWARLFRNNATGNKRKIIDALFWLSQFVMNAHMFLAMFYLKSSDNIYHAFNSIYFLPVIYPVAMFAIGTCIRFVFSQ